MIGSAIFVWWAVEFQVFPLTLVVVLTTLRHYHAGVWSYYVVYCIMLDSYWLLLLMDPDRPVGLVIIVSLLGMKAAHHCWSKWVPCFQPQHIWRHLISNTKRLPRWLWTDSQSIYVMSTKPPQVIVIKILGRHQWSFYNRICAICTLCAKFCGNLTYRSYFMTYVFISITRQTSSSAMRYPKPPPKSGSEIRCFTDKTDILSIKLC